ncbi:MAG: hypothetical protein IT377_09155 [Polyangiaceae bacterium]|nr:hypothetical protein [Polyangiaceae bacterium]
MFFIAQRECAFLSFGVYPQELAAGTALVIDPDVSSASMKYGREGFGHTEGSGLRHDAGSCAAAGFGTAVSAAQPINASPAPRFKSRTTRSFWSAMSTPSNLPVTSVGSIEEPRWPSLPAARPKNPEPT